MEVSKIYRFIEVLAFARKRKDMYVTEVNVATIEALIWGYRSGVREFGYDVPTDMRAEVTEQRGWHFNALGPVDEMRKKGLTEEEVIDELLLIEINAWQKLAHNLGQEPTVRDTSV